MDSERPKAIAALSSPIGWVVTVSFSPDQTKWCFAGGGKKVLLKNLQNNKTDKVFTGHDSWIYGSDFSSNGNFLATGSGDKTIRIWNVLSESESGNSTILKGHSGDVNCVRYFRNDPNHVISCSDDDSIKIWNIERKKEISTLSYESESFVHVSCVDILPDNQTLVSCSELKVQIWDLRVGNCAKSLDLGDVYSVRFHPNSFSIGTGSLDKTIKIFDFRTFQQLQSYKEHSSFVNSVCFHPSGKYLLSGSSDDTVKIFDLLEKKVLFTMEDHSNSVFCVQFSPDGKVFASGGENQVFLWDFPLGRLYRDDKDIDEEERVNYLINQCLLLVVEGEENDFCERNVLKITIDNFCALYSYKFFF